MKLRHLAVIALLTANTAFAGPLTGETLASSGGFFPITPVTAVVSDAAVEFTESFGPRFDINFFESGVVVVTWVGPGGLGHGANDIQTYSDIFSSIDAIIGFNLISTSGVTGITASDLLFNADSLTMQIGAGTVWSAGDSFSAQIVFAAVPEPSTLAILAVGLAGLGFSRRKKA